jgi:hypothetical protein
MSRYVHSGISRRPGLSLHDVQRHGTVVLSAVIFTRPKPWHGAVSPYSNLWESFQSDAYSRV